jgi:acetyl esterase/lipase
VTPERVTYGTDPDQYLDVYRPDGTPRGTVVVIHGGFWKAEYDASQGGPLAESLAAEGWTAANIEYRRVGNGGGVPATLDDVAAAIDALADVDGVDTSTVVTLGHSAGGHLAVWAAARGRFSRWQPERVKVTAAVSQAGVLDLDAAYADGLGTGAVARFVGSAPGPSYEPVDPTRQLPLDVPVRCVHGTADDVAPISQSEAYVAAATAAGADATLTRIEGGDHFVVIDPASDAWARTLVLLAALSSSPPSG